MIEIAKEMNIFCMAYDMAKHLHIIIKKLRECFVLHFFFNFIVDLSNPLSLRLRHRSCLLSPVHPTRLQILKTKEKINYTPYHSIRYL